MVFKVIAIFNLLKKYFNELNRFFRNTITLENRIVRFMNDVCLKIKKIVICFFSIPANLLYQNSIVDVLNNKLRNFFHELSIIKKSKKIKKLFDLEQEKKKIIEESGLFKGYKEIDLLQDDQIVEIFEKTREYGDWDFMILKKLFGNPSKFFKLPVLDVGENDQSEDFFWNLNVNILTAPIMRGKINFSGKICDFFTLRGCVYDGFQLDKNLSVVMVYVHVGINDWQCMGGGDPLSR